MHNPVEIGARDRRGAVPVSVVRVLGRSFAEGHSSSEILGDGIRFEKKVESGKARYQ